MRSHAIPRAFAVSLLMATMALCHSARPLAVSAQSRGVARAQATVLPATAAWQAHDLAAAVRRATIQAWARPHASPGSAAFAHPTSGIDDRLPDEGARSGTGLPIADAAAPTGDVRLEAGGLVAWVDRGDGGRTTITVAHLGS